MSNTSAPYSTSSAPAPPASALDFIKYVDASPDPFNAVHTSSLLLESAGFKKLKESEAWDHHLQRGGKYYYTRNQSALVAFAVGGDFTPGEGGVHVVGAHTDSPCFKLKPVTKKEKAGFIQVGVETYGGGLWSTWWDRDLGLSGRVIVAADASQDCSTFHSKLVHINRPILRIPNLAIHLNRSANDGYKANIEDNMVPILGLVSDQLNSKAAADSAGAEAEGAAGVVGTPTMQSKHHSTLLNILAQELDVSPEQIQDFELSLFDTQGATIGGAHNEFINSARLDNLMSCFCATTALISSLTPESTNLSTSGSIRAICLFDNEEVGSVSNHGAESNMLPSLIRRLAGIQVDGVRAFQGAGDGYDAALAKSFLISSDMAHSIHPNYTSYYEANNSAKLNEGVVVKTNYKQRYASTAVTTFLVRRWARLARSSSSSGVPLQEFSMRNDMPCGSTIGPLLSKNGIRTLDLGIPQLAMHSIREMCGTRDVDHLISLFESFWERGEEVLGSLDVD
jgi:aspartyl aminopeptidase